MVNSHRKRTIGRRATIAIACVVAVLLAGRAGAVDVARGIYSLGRASDIAGTPQDERLSNIRSYDFVAGYTLRVFWTDIEPSQGQYNFSVIDSALASVAALGRGLNLEILNGEEPAYVLAGASATYTDHRGGTNPVPWDTFAQSRMAALYTALANHTVTGPSGSHLLRDDPTLLAIDAAPAGLNFGVRDLNNGIRSHAAYTQQKYIDAVVDGVAASAAAFPHDTNFLAFFGFTDGQPGVPVDEQIIARLAPLYNGPGQPKLDFFIENLSDDGPAPLASGNGVGNNLLDWVNAGGGTMMQALDSWLQHQPDREPQLDSHNAATGIALGYGHYGTRFFELYVSDLDGAASGATDAAGRPIADDLRAWNHTLTAPVTVPGDYNANGQVDAADYVLWRKRLGSTIPLPNDNTLGVDASDHTRWRQHFGEAGGSGSNMPIESAPVPEPLAEVGLGIALCFTVLFNRAARGRPCYVAQLALLGWCRCCTKSSAAS
jgi:hypothetical protein